MKKRILLLAMMIAVLACLFVVSVSADSVKADSTSIDMDISFFDDNGNEVRTTKKVDELFNVSFKNDEEEYYFKLTGVKSWNVEIDGTSYNIKTQLAGLYFPEGITHMPSGVKDGYWGFTAATVDNVRKVHLPESLQCLGGNFLRGIGYVKLVNEDDTLDNYLPSSLNNVNDHLFCYWTLVNPIIYFPEGITNIGSAETTKWHFEGFKAANGSMTIVFLGKMTFVDVDTPENSFNPTFVFAKNKASELWGYALPMVEGSTTVASTSSYVNNTTAEQTLRLYWPSNNGTNASMSTSKQTATIGSTAPKLVFCAGEKVEYVITARFNNSISNYPNLCDGNGVALNAGGTTGYSSSSWMRFYTTPIEYDMDAHNNGTTHYNSIVYQGVNCGYDETTTTTCVVCKLQNVIIGATATGNHKYTDDFNCETDLVCDVCEITLVNAVTHVTETTVKYENGFLDNGVKTVACTNQGCNHKTEQKLLAIFVFNGYSSNREGSAICISYGINNDSLNEYNSVNKELQFGVVASLDKTSPLFVENGEIACQSNTVLAPVTGDFTAFDFILSGFSAEQSNIELAMCAYAYDGSVISYFASESSAVPTTVTLKSVLESLTKM